MFQTLRFLLYRSGRFGGTTSLQEKLFSGAGSVAALPAPEKISAGQLRRPHPTEW